MIEFILFIIISYLIGSIPTAYWIGKIFKGIDIREYGSGNSGTTNTMRVLGWKYAIPTLVFDVFKGYVVTLFANFMLIPAGMEIIHFKAVFGLAAVTGHIFPVFAGFRGGKGIATFAGAVAGISLLTLLICLGVFVIITAITRFVSLGSLIATLVLPVALFFLSDFDLKLCIAGILFFLIALFTHRKNIRRLLNGNENKLSFRKEVS